jgi:hypothetical protein
VTVDRAATIMVNGAPQGASQIIIDYPFHFIVLQPVARLVAPSSPTGSSVNMRAAALMRNEAQ